MEHDERTDPGMIGEAVAPGTLEAWDSMAMVNLIRAVESEFDLQFELDDLLSFESFGAIRQLLVEKGIKDV